MTMCQEFVSGVNVLANAIMDVLYMILITAINVEKGVLKPRKTWNGRLKQMVGFMLGEIV